MKGRFAALACAAALAAAPAAAMDFNWDALGAEFCARSTAGDLAGLAPILSESLKQEIGFVFGRLGEAPPPTLFQSYVNRVPVCVASTRNAALIEIRRSNTGGGPPSWTEYVVVVPEADGSTRIDDVLFATRRSDTLRSRLQALGN